jgi:hypothetical protein
MGSPPESVEQGLVEPATNGGATGAAPGQPRVGSRRDRGARFSLALNRVQLAILAYVGSRVLLLAVAMIDGSLRHWALVHELENWDGGWYAALAVQPYKHAVLHTQTTTGFFPLYSDLVWLVSRPLLLTGHSAHFAVWNAPIIAGVIVSLIGGLVATLLVQRLAAGWWGEAAGLRAAALFCFFPGSVVFSMVYAEGIMIPLAAGCIVALQRRRWLLAGVLAGIATASEPEAVVLVLVCAVSAVLELRRRGWEARKALVAPLLAPAGLIAVLAYLWAWTGTPLAYTTAQHYGWRESFDPIALIHLAIRLAHHISFAHFNHPTINLNWPVGLVGAVVLAVLLVLMVRIRRTISVEAWVWTLGISFLAVTSEWVPPNPRLLITAFPAVIVIAYYLKRRAFGAMLLANGALLAGMSALTFVGVTLRP